MADFMTGAPAVSPLTPRKEDCNRELNALLRSIAERWKIDLPIREEPYSPSKSTTNSFAGERCFKIIRFLFFKARHALDGAINAFEVRAREVAPGWALKPLQDVGTLPGRQPPQAFVELLLPYLEIEYRVVKQELAGSRAAYNAVCSPHRGRITETQNMNNNAIPGNSVSEDAFWRPDYSARDSPNTAHSKKRSREVISERAPTPKWLRARLDASSAMPSRVHTRVLTPDPREDTHNPQDGFTSPPWPSRPGRSIAATETRKSFSGRNDFANPGFNTANLNAHTSFNTTLPSANTSFNTTIPSANTSFNCVENSLLTPFTSFNSIDDAAARDSQQLPIRRQRQLNIGTDKMELDKELALNDLPSYPRLNVRTDTPPSGYFSGPLPALLTKEQPLESYLIARLNEFSPFKPMPYSLNGVSLRARYELTRISLATGVELSSLSLDDLDPSADYATFWSRLQQHRSLQGKALPEKSDPEAWDLAGKDFSQVWMRGELERTDLTDGPLFKLSLRPLNVNGSYRLGRRFGFDRFFKLTVPIKSDDNSQRLKTGCGALQAQRHIHAWLAGAQHAFVGRVWSAFFHKDSDKKSREKDIKASGENKVDACPTKEFFLFATDGCDFLGINNKGLPCKDEPIDARTPMSVKAMLEWLIPFDDERNQEQPYLKLFARISLGLTTTEPACLLKPSQIEWTDKNITSPDNPDSIMNDGCGIISPALAYKIAQSLDIQGPVPSAFQARIAGAKGLWIVDPCMSPHLVDLDDENACRIVITPSQRKFHSHPEDKDENLPTNPDREDRMQFEVLNRSKPLRPQYLGPELITILEDRGVPGTTFRTLLKDHLRAQLLELKTAMSEGVTFRKWIHDHGLSSFDDNTPGWAGGLPWGKAEKIIMLLEGGFKVHECRFLKDLSYKLFADKCLRLLDKVKIPVGRSTYAYCVPDVTQTLEEGTVHLGFSGMFSDPGSNFHDTMLNDIDVLVARAPMSRPCDVQKVHAVFNPRLSRLKDVIVFSTRGKVPLAHLLSGGDYDGDQVWICWDPRVVEPFHNAEEPVEPRPEELGIIVEKTTIKETMPVADIPAEMIKRAFSFGAIPNLLGRCTTLHGDLCYTENSISCKGARWIAALLGFLVDREKQGYVFTMDAWSALRGRKDLFPNRLAKPAYKNRKQTPPRLHNVLDNLMYNVAKPVIDETLGELHNALKDVPSGDEDLSVLWKEVITNKDPEIVELGESLKAKIKEILPLWSSKCSNREDDWQSSKWKSGLDECCAKYEAIRPPESSHPLVSWWARGDERATCGRDDSSEWKLLKASAAFSLCPQKNFSWHMAGRQLVILKLKANNRMRPVDELIHASYKPDARFVKRWQAKLMGLRNGEDFEDDEFGDIDPGLFDGFS